MEKRKILYAVLMTLVGASLFVYGGIDDSPGGQLIGLVLVVVGVVGVVKNKKNISN